MGYQSFGKIAVQPDKAEAFVKEAEGAGLSVSCVRANIYDVGMQTPSMMSPDHLRQQAGLIGLKYSAGD